MPNAAFSIVLIILYRLRKINLRRFQSMLSGLVPGNKKDRQCRSF